MVVEGYDELRLALRAGVRVNSLFHCPTLMTNPEQLQLLKKLTIDDKELFELSAGAFAKASIRQSPDGWLAVVPTPGQPLHMLRLSANPLLLVCEGVEKPGNLGAMLRTADAAGVDAVIAAAPVTDWGNPNVVRASKGALFAVQIAAASSPEVSLWLRESGVSMLAASPSPQARSRLDQVDLTQGTAIVVGAERSGLDAFWLDAADTTVSIPMFGQVNSLNVATAAAIIVYEAVRQRRHTQL